MNCILNRLAVMGVLCLMGMLGFSSLASAQTTIFYDNFGSGSLNSTYWTANPGPNNGLATVVSGISCSGAHHLRLGKTSDAGGWNTASADLTLDLSAYVDSQLILSFCTYDYVDEEGAEDGVFASNDGGITFDKIIRFTPGLWENFTWGEQYVWDLDELLRNKFGVVPASLILRFQQRGTGNFQTSGDEDGIGIDRVRIRTERQVVPATVPYFQGFGAGTLPVEYRIASREAANNSYTLLSRFPRLGVNNTALIFGKTSDIEGVNLNAIDLHVVLGTYADSQLLFNYSTYDYVEEYQSLYDGVFASIDQGANFTKIINFEPGRWENFTWGRRVPYDLDQLLRNAFSTTTLPDTLILRFVQYGTGNFNTSGDEDGIILDNITISVEAPRTYATVPYFTSFSNGVLPPEWRNRSREENNRLGLNALNRFERLNINSNHLYLGKASDIEGANLNSAELSLVLGTYVDSQLYLNLTTYDYQDELQSQREGVWASIDQGVSFQKIIEFNPALWTNFTFGRRVPYDLDQLIKTTFNVNVLPDTLLLRFTQYGTGDFSTSGDEDGIILDNIAIGVARPQVYTSIPYFQSFESGTFDDPWVNTSTLAINQTALSASTNQLNRFWEARVYNTTGAVTGTYAMRMGKSSDLEGANLNALDLHVNLQGESQVELKYFIYKYYDEKQVDDGIFMSVDGGQGYFKIYDYDLDNIANNTWIQQTVDLSAAAAAQGLSLSDSTIIRFQQRGTGDFSTSGDEDGLIFDDIEINCLPQVANFGFTVDCSNQSVSFSDSTQGTNSTTPFAWDFDGDGLVDTVANGNITHVYASTGTYDVTLYIGNAEGCGDSITQQVFIGSTVPAPTLNPAGPGLDLCAGQTLTLSAQLGYQGYLWNDGSTGTNLTVNAPGTYSVRGLGIDGCYSTPTVVTVTQRPAPLKPFLSLSGPTTFCELDSVELIAPFGASAYQWSNGAMSQSIIVKTSGTYSVQIVNSFGCLSPAADTTITVLPTPPTPAIGQTQGSTWLSSSATGQIYRWFLDGNPIAADSQSIDASLFGAGSYTVQVANGECESGLSDPYAFELTGIEHLWSGSLTVYPNPTQGQITLHGTQEGGLTIDLELRNPLGQSVLPTQTIQVGNQWEKQLNLSHLPNGIYILTVRTGQQRYQQRVVLLR